MSADVNAQLLFVYHTLLVITISCKGQLTPLTPDLRSARLSYLSADVNARLLFVSQPARHATPGSAAFCALLLPALPSGAPSHWLSPESTQTLRQECSETGLDLLSLKSVVGRVVAVVGPAVVSPADAGRGPTEANPYNLGAGEVYYVVHAEMVLSHCWADEL